MTRYEEIEEEVRKIQSYLEIDCSDNVDEIAERLKTLNVYQARSGFLLAEVQKMYRQKRASEISEIIVSIAKENYLSAKAQNALVDSMAQDEAFLVDWLDRIYATTVHQQDVLRSILSYEKESLRLNNTGY
jgi:DNA-binding ferritin-like protein